MGVVLVGGHPLATRLLLSLSVSCTGGRPAAPCACARLRDSENAAQAIATGGFGRSYCDQGKTVSTRP
jgi:hypothetical protein